MAGSLTIPTQTLIMMKIVVCLVALLLTGIAGFGQLKGFSLGPFAEAAYPTGSFAETNKNGYGLGLGADVRLGKIGVSGSVGYMRFGGKDVKTGDGIFGAPAVKAVPGRVGLKYRFVPALYAKVETGVARFTGSNKESAIIFSPGIGVRLLGLDIQGKYEIWSAAQTYRFWGIKAGINF
jgi:hypothetical protein